MARCFFILLIGFSLLASGCHYAYPEPEERDPYRYPTNFSEGPVPVSVPFLMGEGVGQAFGIPVTILLLPFSPWMEDEGHVDNPHFRVPEGMSSRQTILMTTSMWLGYTGGVGLGGLPWLATIPGWGWFFHPYREVDWNALADLVPDGPEGVPVSQDLSFEKARRGIDEEAKPKSE